MGNFNRLVLVIVEGLGLGAAPDAAAFADNGADTLGHLRSHFRARLQLPTLQKMGLAALHPLLDSTVVPEHSYYGRLRQLSRAKSALEDYWELMGVVNQAEPTTYPGGFPAVVVQRVEQQFHRPVLVNAPYQPQRLLEDYGDAQVQTGGLLLSTSGGSDLLVSGHEASISASELGQVGQFIRQLFDQYPGARLQEVVSIPFAGVPGQYYYRRADQQVFYRRPPQPTLVDRVRAQHFPLEVLTGATAFAELQVTLQDSNNGGLYLVPVHELDQAGYRRDPELGGQSLMEVDRLLGATLPLVGPTDLLLVTATHGNDPVFAGEASTREWLPLLAYSPVLQGGRLADRSTLADIAATVQDLLGLEPATNEVGHSFSALLV